MIEVEALKRRCGIASGIKTYDEEIIGYIDDCISEMRASGIPQRLFETENQEVSTAVTFYVKANLGNDRTDTDKYMQLYRRKVARLALEED